MTLPDTFKWEVRIIALVVCAILIVLVILCYPSVAAPINHTVSNINFNLVVKDGINKTYIKNSLSYVNPFYTFTFSDTIQNRRNQLVIQYGAITRGTESNIWINPFRKPSEKTLGLLIQHECLHWIGNPHEKKPQEIINQYINQTKSYKGYTINRFIGNNPSLWTSMVIHG